MEIQRYIYAYIPRGKRIYSWLGKRVNEGEKDEYEADTRAERDIIEKKEKEKSKEEQR